MEEEGAELRGEGLTMGRGEDGLKEENTLVFSCMFQFKLSVILVEKVQIASDEKYYMVLVF